MLFVLAAGTAGLFIAGKKKKNLSDTSSTITDHTTPAWLFDLNQNMVEIKGTGKTSFSLGDNNQIPECGCSPAIDTPIEDFKLLNTEVTLPKQIRLNRPITYPGEKHSNSLLN